MENNRMGDTSNIFKKIRDTKGIFHADMGTIKNRSSMDLVEAEVIKKRWQEYTGELYRKDLNDPQENHNGVITHLELDILECEVKWASGSITTNKVLEVMDFQLSHFKLLKRMLLKCCTQYASKFGNLSSGHRTGKGQFSFQSQGKAVPKNAQNTVQLHSFYMLVKLCSKVSKLDFNSTWTKNCQMFKLDLKKAEESEIKLWWSVGS